MSRNQIFLRISWHSTLLRSFLGRLLDGVGRATIDLVVFLLSTLFRDWATHWGSTSYIGSPLIEENFESMPPGLLDFGQKCRRFRDHPLPLLPPPPPSPNFTSCWAGTLGHMSLTVFQVSLACDLCLAYVNDQLYFDSNWTQMPCPKMAWTESELLELGHWGNLLRGVFIKDGPSLGFSWKVWNSIRIVQTKLILFHWRSPVWLALVQRVVKHILHCC